MNSGNMWGLQQKRQAVKLSQVLLELATAFSPSLWVMYLLPPIGKNPEGGSNGKLLFHGLCWIFLQYFKNLIFTFKNKSVQL